MLATAENTLPSPLHLAPTVRQASTMTFQLKDRAQLVGRAATRQLQRLSQNSIAETASRARQILKLADPLTAKNA